MEQKPVPDCGTCWRRDTCEKAEDGKFCAAWQSKQPQERHPTPDELWDAGETPWDL